MVQLKGIAADEARFERGLSAVILRILSILERRNARRADRVVVPSLYSAEVAARAYGLDPERIAVVPEALAPEPWRRLRASSPPRPGTAPTILSVARQYPRKNTHTLLRALLRVTSSLPDVRLRVVGGGPELPRLKAAVRDLGLEDRVDLLGTVADSEDVRREYFRADCFCLPSLQEGFGIVFLEAMAAGLPVVAGRAGAVPEVVPDGEAGLLVDPEDPQEIADAILRVLTDPDLSRRLGAAGVERAERFTPARTADAFLDAVRPLRDESTSRDEPAHRRDRDVAGPHARRGRT